MIRWLLVLAAVLSGAAEVARLTKGCGACEGHSLPLGLIGAVFYMLLAMLVWQGNHFGWLSIGSGFAAGVHAQLVRQMAFTNSWCGFCLATTFIGTVVFILCMIQGRRSSLSTVLGVLLALGLGTFLEKRSGLPPAPSSLKAEVRLTIFVQEGCGFCDELRDRIMPVIEREFKGRIHVSYSDARRAFAIRRTPTIVIQGRTSRVIEGLPAVETLRKAVLEEARS